jgi:cell division protein FtsI/penicillin-binding protein 2
VPFTVRARVAHGEVSADWSYASQLTVLPAAGDGEPLVAWAPQLPHPELAEGRTLELAPLEDAAPVRVLDSAGEELTAEDHPALAGILAQLGERYAEESGASPGLALRIAGDEGDEDADAEPLLTLAEPAAGEVPTTLDREVQRAAEEALAKTPRAAMVAVEPSSGAIRAVVNVPADGDDLALNGRNSPGSTWKIVTAGMLLDEGLAEPDAAHPCPKFFEHGGWEFHNLDEFDIKGGTFTQSFAASCNTAFISAAPELDDGQLGAYAKRVFGVGLDWQTGVESLSGSVPAESDAQLAAQLIGQAGVLVNPLVMASVSATVKEGAFRQPYLVPPEFDGRQLATAEGPSAETAAQLRRLMHATATGGTAAAAMSGLKGDIGAKTGSAEVFDQEKPNAWFTAYRDDLAVAAVVPDSGHGGKFAGPLVAEVLRSAG